MRSFQQVVVFLFALLACAFAQSTDTEVYDATVYITSTVYRVNTVTMSGSPTGSVANMTSTIPAPSHMTAYPSGSFKPNGTTSAPTSVKPSSPAFTGAASAMGANAYVAALAAGVAYLVL